MSHLAILVNTPDILPNTPGYALNTLNALNFATKYT